MDAAEWLTCNDPDPMLQHLKGKISDRKSRLFACACVRQIWHLLDDPRSVAAIEVAERYADRLASPQELIAAQDAAWDAARAAAQDAAQAAAQAAAGS